MASMSNTEDMSVLVKKKKIVLHSLLQGQMKLKIKKTENNGHLNRDL